MCGVGFSNRWTVCTSESQGQICICDEVHDEPRHSPMKPPLGSFIRTSSCTASPAQSSYVVLVLSISVLGDIVTCHSLIREDAPAICGSTHLAVGDLAHDRADARFVLMNQSPQRIVCSVYISTGLHLSSYGLIGHSRDSPTKTLEPA